MVSRQCTKTSITLKARQIVYDQAKKPRYSISLVCSLVWSVLVAELEHETNLLCNKT